ncbi:hypothetical protein Taro_028927 [Colocasia esculenta]|uniref:RanBP2-type domain-containing protein n=1 Tax=Colocasia esculenta TaxID=4460 RepID=A0A843VYR1_COLES|nr:hypothetical protein [Colocasia esculenta]
MACGSKLPMLLSTPSPLLCPRPSLIHLARLNHLPLTSLSFAVSGAQHHHAPSSSSCCCSQPRHGFLLRAAAEQVHTATSTGEDCSVASHPWPEWVKMVEHVTACGYTGREGVDEEDAFSASEGLPEEFTRAVGACLLFAREKPHLLRLLPRRDVEVVVQNGSPFLFENKLSSVRRMKFFISSDGSNELGSEQACTVDVVKYLLSYVCNSLGKNGGDDIKYRELVETSVRSLLSELIKADSAVREPNTTNSAAGHTSFRHEESQRPSDQKIGMKRGDWICPKCSFINFSRNTECLECKEARPRRQLTGQEWECPQCDFFNHGRNVACLRCDCKCPEKILASERRLGNDQSVQRSGNDNLVDVGNSMGGTESWKLTESAISQKLDRILGRSPATSETKDTGNQSVLGQAGGRTGRRFASPERRDPGYVPFVPLPADMFRKKPTEEQKPSGKEEITSVKADELMDTVTQGFASGEADKSSFSEEFNELTVGNTKKKSSDPSETLSTNPAQLSDDTNVSGSMSDDDFPEIMPMRKGENRFVVSKKKDRSLTSPQYKRRMALEQANNSSFVPFVPFPPNYFAKDKQPKDGSSNKSAAESSSTVAGNAISMLQNDEEDKTGGTIRGGSGKQTESTKTNRNKEDTDILLSNSAGTFSSESSQESNAGVSSLDRGVENPQDTTQNGGRVFSGKSLEGSAVTEPDPLDMSEEAKAQRWFRRVAQITDISELSKIPDEDFPEIMPMRKGINRFVVSKRKTPLERRLTSQQYRRNLPIVSSEPEKDSS